MNDKDKKYSAAAKGEGTPQHAHNRQDKSYDDRLKIVKKDLNYLENRKKAVRQWQKIPKEQRAKLVKDKGKDFRDSYILNSIEKIIAYPVNGSENDVGVGIYGKITQGDKISWILNAATKKGIRYNSLSQALDGPGYSPLQEKDINTMLTDFRVRYKVSITKNFLLETLKSEHLESYHPMREYLDSVRNMLPRKTALLVKNTRAMFELLKVKIPRSHTKEEALEHKKRLFRLFQKYMMQFIGIHDGHVADLMLILYSEKQGVRKNTFFKHLLPPDLRKHYYAEAGHINKKDYDIIMTKVLLMHDDELKQFKKRDPDAIKSQVSQSKNNDRRSYDRIETHADRTGIHAGSTNIKEILRDHTGNRRFILFEIDGVIDIDKMDAIDRGLIFCELLHTYNKDGWVKAMTLNKEDQQFLDHLSGNFEIRDIEEQLVIKYMYKPKNTEDLNNRMQTGEILICLRRIKGCPNITPANLGKALKKHGYEQKSIRKKDSTPRRVWCVDFTKEYFQEPGVKP